MLRSCRFIALYYKYCFVQFYHLLSRMYSKIYKKLWTTVSTAQTVKTTNLNMIFEILNIQYTNSAYFCNKSTCTLQNTSMLKMILMNRRIEDRWEKFYQLDFLSKIKIAKEQLRPVSIRGSLGYEPNAIPLGHEAVNSYTI